MVGVLVGVLVGVRVGVLVGVLVGVGVGVRVCTSDCDCASAGNGLVTQLVVGVPLHRSCQVSCAVSVNGFGSFALTV